jgi:hypothetical protein
LSRRSRIYRWPDGCGSIELPLVELKLSDPAAMAAVDGELVLNEISEGDATRSGEAKTARILASDGAEVLSCDVGAVDSDAVIRLGTTSISIGRRCGSTVFGCRARDLAGVENLAQNLRQAMERPPKCRRRSGFRKKRPAKGAEKDRRRSADVLVRKA